MDKKLIKKYYDDAYSVQGLNYGRVKNSEGLSRKELEIDKFCQINQYWQQCQISPESKVLEIGAGLGHMSRIHKNWVGIEYSDTAIKIAKSIYGEELNINQGDVTDLPYLNDEFDFVFTFATLEHVPDILGALSEIIRVTKNRGIIYLEPAWSCRKWTVKKLQIRPYKELSFLEKLEKLLIPIRNSLIYRAGLQIPKRGLREMKFYFMKKQDIVFSQLTPDFSLNKKYPHISDDDAQVSIDMHSVILFFKSENWQVLSHKSALSRILAKGGPVVFRKN